MDTARSLTGVDRDAGDTDDVFLRRVSLDSRGNLPTRIEQEYFLADKDPKKREKLLDLLLKDSVVAKKVGAGWKQKLLGTDAHLTLLRYRYSRLLATERLHTHVDRLGALVGELLAKPRPDEQVLDSLTAAVLGRLPTEGEKVRRGGRGEGGGQTGGLAGSRVRAVGYYGSPTTRRGPQGPYGSGTREEVNTIQVSSTSGYSSQRPRRRFLKGL